MKKMKAVVFASLLSLLITFLVLILLAFIISKAGLPSIPILTVSITLLCCLSVFCGGYVAALLAKERGIFFGFLTGAAFLGILLAASLIVFPNGFAMVGIGKAIAVLLSGAIGGIVGANKKEKIWI